MKLAMRDWNGKNVVILGAARQGIATAGYLAGKNARIILSDLKSEEMLADAKTTLATLTDNDNHIVWIYGEHPLSMLTSCDALFVSGGVPLTIPIVQEAIRRGIPLVNDSQLFLEIVPCPVIGITGSAGKTTTTSLTAKIFETASANPESGFYLKKVWVGGNIGTPLITSVESIKSDDLVVLELSSFQLEIMTMSPSVAVLLNISPDHLDRHSSMDAYLKAKSNIFHFQTQQDLAIMCRDDENVSRLVSESPGIPFSFGFTVLPDNSQGCFLEQNSIYFKHDAESGLLASVKISNRFEKDNPQLLIKIENIPLKGEHNLLNVMAACTVAGALGLSSRDIMKGISEFKGVPNRMEFVRSWRNAEWYNDSIATTPARTAAAIKAFSEPLILLAGGRNKNLSWKEFASLITKRVDHLIVFGENADRILEDIGYPSERGFDMIHCQTMSDAVFVAAEIVQPGDVVLLSPGGTSFDEFKDYEERGECFRKLVWNLK